MSEQGIADIMYFLVVGVTWYEEVSTLVDHLYQLHQLRDAAIYSDLRYRCALARDTVTLLKIDEMYCGS